MSIFSSDKAITFLNDCIAYTLENTNIHQLLKRIYGPKIDEAFQEELCSLIVQSIIVAQLADFRYKDLLSMYGRSGQYKSIKDYSNRDAVEEKIEKSLSKGMDEFLDAFEGEFESHTLLRKSLRKFFKNYKFREIHATNDYAILYFTFKLYDIFCNEIDDKVAQERAAVNFAQKAYEALRNPHRKKQVTVTCDSLISYVQSFDVVDCLDTYIYVLSAFASAIYCSENLSEISRYNLFARFFKHILPINLVLAGAKTQTSYREVSMDESEETADAKVIYKSVSNMLYYLQKNQKLGHEELEIARKLHHLITQLPKNREQYEKMAKKRFHTMCIDIFEAIECLQSIEGPVKKYVEKILFAYANIRFADRDSTFSIYELVVFGIQNAASKTLKKLIPTGGERNAYVQLLFSMATNIEGSQHDITTAYFEVIDPIEAYIYERLNFEFTNKEKEVLLDTIAFVELNYLSMPILTKPEMVNSYLDEIKLHLF